MNAIEKLMRDWQNIILFAILSSPFAILITFITWLELLQFHQILSDNYCTSTTSFISCSEPWWDNLLLYILITTFPVYVSMAILAVVFYEWTKLRWVGLCISIFLAFSLLNFTYTYAAVLDQELDKENVIYIQSTGPFVPPYRFILDYETVRRLLIKGPHETFCNQPHRVPYRSDYTPKTNAYRKLADYCGWAYYIPMV